MAFATQNPTARESFPDSRILSVLSNTGRSDGELREAGIVRAQAGRLAVPTGRLILCDLTVDIAEAPSFVRTIDPGDYSVDVYLYDGSAEGRDWGTRVGLAELKIATGTPVRWDLAKLTDDGASPWIENFSHPIFIDSAKACFIDVETRDAIVAAQIDSGTPGKDYVLDVLHGSVAYALLIVPAIAHQLRFDPKQNLVAFETGFGDGTYRAFWGFDTEDRLVSLVVDFDVMPPREDS
ncbi:DUF4241 domain-containing protein [Aurantimonas sp. E1-2-R+4]|uniref:DUF4241 domain-containing protein n=1 Tax=Aurantimonas sp. E1-2-R+4 TaxID=3113714 RepID=UPI002F944FD8